MSTAQVHSDFFVLFCVVINNNDNNNNNNNNNNYYNTNNFFDLEVFLQVLIHLQINKLSKKNANL